MKKPTQAIVLAAGFGTRLRPLTDLRPKPILPVGGVPMILFNLALLQESGIRDVLINVHHLPQLIQKLLAPLSKQGFRFQFSLEKEILGTAGGIAKALKHMRRESTFVLNGDIVADVDLKKMAELHDKSQARATLASIAPETAPIKSYIEFDPRGKIHRIAGNPHAFSQKDNVFQKGIFTGFQLLEPELLDNFPPKKLGCIVRDIYQPNLARGEKLQNFEHHGSWWDLGSLQQLKDVDQKFWRREVSKRMLELWEKVRGWNLGISH